MGLVDLEVRHDEIMRDVLVSVENLLGDPESERAQARRNRGGPSPWSVNGVSMTATTPLTESGMR